MVELFHSHYTIHRACNTQKWYSISVLYEGQC